MMDSTKAGRLYRRMSMDSFERLQRPFSGCEQLETAGDVALDDADPFVDTRRRNGGGEARGPAADHQDVIEGACVHLGLVCLVRGDGLNGGDGLGQHVIGQCGLDFTLIAGLGE